MKMTKDLIKPVMMSLLVMTLTAACGKGLDRLQQDPFADQPEDIRKGVPVEAGKGDGKKPDASDALRIDAPDFFSFKEGLPGEVTLTGRVLIPLNGRTPVINEDFAISIENLADFPGATFDPATGVLAWTPAKGAVDSAMSRNLTLTVVLTTNVAPIRVRTKDIMVFVTRSESDPEVVSVTGLNYWDTIREDETRKFTVKVKDPDGIDRDNYRPRVLPVISTSNKNGVSMVGLDTSVKGKNPEQDATDPTLWTFQMLLDVRGQEVTKDEDDFGFGVIALSRFGRSSAPKDVTYTVRTAVPKPVSTWTTTYEVYAGQPNVINFSAFDPQDEGTVSMSFTTCSTLLAGATCSCQSQTASSTLSCSIKWTPPTTIADNTMLKLVGTMTNTVIVNWSKEAVTAPFNGNIRVINKTPPPTPTSEPTPVPLFSNQTGRRGGLS